MTDPLSATGPVALTISPHHGAILASMQPTT
jgi:hypothetical protein